MTQWLARRGAWLSLCMALWLLAGCATRPPTPLPTEEVMRWQGRLSIKLFTSPVQAWSAGFVLTGDPQQGSLLLSSPLGSVVAHLQWSGNSASLKTADGNQQFDSLQALVVRASGTDLPVAALFAWLQGQAMAVPGWEVELPSAEKKRLFAWQRLHSPHAELKMVLE
jgi:outer membrane lipoprotein LolB